MIESATGLVLRTRLLTETSLIVHWLTADFGRVTTVAKGARRPKSAFAGKLDLFYMADFSFSRSRRSELHTLREVTVRETHGSIREDIFKLRQAAYATAILEQTTEIDTPLPGYFGLLAGFLDCLCRQPNAPQLVFALELKLLNEMGLAPDLAEVNLPAGTIKIATRLTEIDWAAGLRLKLTVQQISELRDFLSNFLILHLGRLPAGRPAALFEKG